MCKNGKCWEKPQGAARFCSLHLKIVRHRALDVIRTLPSRLKSPWEGFLRKVRANLEKDDPSLIAAETFFDLIPPAARLTISEKDLITDALEGKTLTGGVQSLRIEKILQLKNEEAIKKLYENIDLSSDEEGEMGDFSGYTGSMVRKRTDLLPLTADQLYAAIARS